MRRGAGRGTHRLLARPCSRLRTASSGGLEAEARRGLRGLSPAGGGPLRQAPCRRRRRAARAGAAGSSRGRPANNDSPPPHRKERDSGQHTRPPPAGAGPPPCAPGPTVRRNWAARAPAAPPWSRAAPHARTPPLATGSRAATARANPPGAGPHRTRGRRRPPEQGRHSTRGSRRSRVATARTGPVGTGPHRKREPAIRQNRAATACGSRRDRAASHAGSAGTGPPQRARIGRVPRGGGTLGLQPDRMMTGRGAIRSVERRARRRSGARRSRSTGAPPAPTGASTAGPRRPRAARRSHPRTAPDRPASGW